MDISLLTFALMALIVVMTPGPTVLLALSNGTRFGVLASGYGILGAALSDVLLITAAALGLGALLATSAVLFNFVKWLGVAYLIWLGMQMLRSSGGLGQTASADDAGPEYAPLALFRKSFLAAATNPKGYLFFTAFFPQFLNPDQPLAAQYLVLALIFVTIDVLVMAAYAGLGARAMRFLSQRGALWIERTCGGLLVTMGLALAFLRRAQS